MNKNAYTQVNIQKNEKTFKKCLHFIHGGCILRFSDLETASKMDAVEREISIMNAMKKILTAALAAVLCLSITACGGDNSADSPYGTKTAGVLTVATSPDYAPYEFYAIDAEGNPKLAGFDIELAKYIADYLGLELELIPMDFDGVLLELANGSVDLGVAGLSPDPDRMLVMDFSDVYYEGGQSFITVKDKAEMFSSLEDANNPAISVGAQNGAIQMDLAQLYSADTEIVALTKATDIIAELVSGKLDGAYVETAVAESYMENYPELHIVCEVPYDVEGNAVGVVKGNAELLAGVNEAIAACIEDGSFNKFVTEALELASGEIHEGLIEE